ncbi:protein FAR-RED IMPAIRED RESPONSE 1-like [Vicia villosa]|uniref:protein FAR-RED IMPAIRED RESPONSE 1-like n=1 Tax=Vicia villosa TaxID=3911 RepID=UPI00273B805C|nr:protein FAR-RED IMPAIRED RESPONSE 1-like [Vicia villosa]
MDSLNILIDSGDSQREDVEVDHDDGDGDDSRWVPEIGMCFYCVEEVKTYYQQYALKKGFGWRIRSSKKGDDGELNYIILSCSRGGSTVSKISCTLKTLPSRAKNCPAKIYVKMKEDGLWYITQFESIHSHETSPTKARLFKANKKMNLHVRRKIQINVDAGVRINKTFQSLVKDAGRHENIPFCEKDVRNYINKERRAIGKEGDGKALISYFCKMREQNTNFFYDIDLDDDFHVRNVFWADARSRAAYEYFGDVVTFDTTYLTNKYDMPFAAFVGVNHHGQSTLLGCGLLSGEDTDSFVWLFKSWLRCMLEKPPMGIVTDQCKAMKNAIELVFPTTRHRWCLWHIMKKIPEKLSGYGEYKRIKYAMKEAVYDTFTTDGFEQKWSLFIEKFNLQENDWLGGLYMERHRWAPTLLRKYFWAGMSTTQRSESIHAFFDGYINSTTSLNQFVKQYDNALRSRAEKEFEADFNSMDTTIPCGSNSTIEKQFQNKYTHAKFKEIQVEFRSKMNCSTSLKGVEGCFATYHVLEEILVGEIRKERVLKVVLNKENHDFKCECSLFEFRELKPKMDKFDKLCKHFYEVAEVAADSDETTDDLHETLHLFSSNMSIKDSVVVEENINEDSNPINSNHIRSPKHVKRKGRPPSKRKIFVSDTIVKRSRKQTKKSDHIELTTECNIGMVGSQLGSNICVESSLEVVNGGHCLNSNIVVGGNMSFMDLLTTCETPLVGSSQVCTN